MRWPLGVAALLAASACGPSAETIKLAKAETYADPPEVVFARAVAATQHKGYAIGAIDCSTRSLITTARTYCTEDHDSAVSTSIVYARIRVPVCSRSTAPAAMYLRVVPTAGRTAVVVTPRVWSGPPGHGGYVLDDDDPMIPEQVASRADVLRLEIHDYETQGLSAPDPCRKVATDR